jgi:hypothetical protein
MNNESSSSKAQATQQAVWKPSKILFGLIAVLGVAFACQVVFFAIIGDSVWYGRLLVACLIGAYSTSYLANINLADPKERRSRAVSAANTKGVVAFLVFAFVKFLFA